MFQFKKYPQRVGEEIAWSKRRESFAKSKPMRIAKKDAKKMPLFADELIDAAQNIEVDVEDIVTSRQGNLDRTIQQRRDDQAVLWRKARKRFFGLSEEHKGEVLRRYNGNRWMPKEPRCLWSIIDDVSGDQARRLEQYDNEYKVWCDANNAKQASFGVQVALF